MTASSESSLFLHIGTEKTGTTSLQFLLRDSEPQLNANGFSFFCGEERSYFSGHGHFPLVGCFLSERVDFVPSGKISPPDSILECLERDLGTSPFDAIISAEHFSSRSLSSNNLRELKRAFGKRSVTVVVYLRPQYELLESSYFTGVSYGRVDRLSHHDAGTSDPYYNYSMMLMNYAEVFGASSILVRDYRTVCDVRDDFLLQIGLGRHVINFDEKNIKNKRISSQQVELLRLCNSYLGRVDEVTHEELERANFIRNRIKNAAPHSESAFYNILSNDQCAEIIEKFRPCNSKIEEDYLHPGALEGWNRYPNRREPKALRLKTSYLIRSIAELARHAQEEALHASKERGMTMKRLSDTIRELKTMDVLVKDLTCRLDSKNHSVAQLEIQSEAQNANILELKANVAELREIIHSRDLENSALKSEIEKTLDYKIRALFSSLFSSR